MPPHPPRVVCHRTCLHTSYLKSYLFVLPEAMFLFLWFRTSKKTQMWTTKTFILVYVSNSTHFIVTSPCIEV